ncbi:unnamed protein product [Owenia fusiformis]|uniref:Uncharacterized protein n=1 Tax=Owenia fusiformis TaxID=6347 RepID=A0A8S4MTX2_OWEFU|nr:unnamed protein product [Owenia fusiformis]
MGHGTKLRRPTLRGNAQFDVKFHFWQDKEATVGSKSIRKSSSLNGDELHKVRTAINLQNVLGDIEDRSSGGKIKECWCWSLVYHIPYFLQRYGNIHCLGTHCLEQKNHVHHKLYQSSTRRDGVNSKVSSQIMQWENHQLPGKLYKVERQKRANNYTEDGLDAFNRSMQERLNFVYPEEQEMEV